MTCREFGISSILYLPWKFSKNHWVLEATHTNSGLLREKEIYLRDIKIPQTQAERSKSQTWKQRPTVALETWEAKVQRPKTCTVTEIISHWMDFNNYFQFLFSSIQDENSREGGYLIILAEASSLLLAKGY